MMGRQWICISCSARGLAMALLALSVLLGAFGASVIAVAQDRVDTLGQLPPDKILVKVRFTGDYLAVEDFVKGIGAEILRQEPSYLYLLVDKSRLADLRQGGRQPEIIDPRDFFQRLVRIEGPAGQQTSRLQGLGANVVQQAPDHTVVRMSLRQLDALRQEKIEFRAIEQKDLVPRLISIPVPDAAALQLVVSAGVDIFEVKNNVVYGRALDGQVEMLRQHGLRVEPVSQIPR